MPTMSLGGLPLPMPLRDGISVPIQTIGFGQRMHDGSYRSDIVARKAQITIRWKKLTATEMGLVEAAMYQAFGDGKVLILPNGRVYTCLLYTSDAADERSSVDLGGRRIIKKNRERCTVSSAIT